MFGIRRKIGTGTTSRRRPSRQCRLEVEGMETRALLSITLSSPGSPIVESGLGAQLNVAFDTHGNAFAQFQSSLTVGGVTVPVNTLVPLVSTIAPVPGVDGPGTNNPVTLAYALPTAVNPGDVAIANYQAPGKLSDVLRFTDVVNPATNSVQGWLLVYSDSAPPAIGPGVAPITALPTAGAGAFIPNSPLNGIAESFGVPGLSVADYAAVPPATPPIVGVPPEQAVYSFLSEGNLLPIALPS
jgi:hypothetical protein